jgi:hypothetical protein
MWLNREGTLYPGIQTTCTSVRADATQDAKHWAEYGPWPVHDEQGRPSHCASGAGIQPSLPNAPITTPYVLCKIETFQKFERFSKYDFFKFEYS